MFNLQGSEIIVILLLALVVLGPEKLPGAVRRFTKTYAELKKMGTSFQDEVKSAFDEPMREVRETADLVKKQVDLGALEAEAEAEAAARGTSAGLSESGVANDSSAAGGIDGEDGTDTPGAMPPPVAGTGRPGPNAVPPPPNVPAPPPPFSGSGGTPAAPTTDSGSASPTEQGGEPSS